MKSCSPSLSWDGVLCSRCRAAFNTPVEKAMLHNWDQYSGPTGTHTESIPWHNFDVLKRYAALHCKFCTLVLACLYDDLDQQEVKRLETANGELLLCLLAVKSQKALAVVTYPSCIYPVNSTRHIRGPCNIMIERTQIDAQDVCVPDHPVHDTLDASTGSPNTMSKVLRWLQTCEKHAACQKWSTIGSETIRPTVPMRLLEVDRGASHPEVRLISSEDLSSDHLRYATLSYCWGNKLPVRLLKQNLAEYRSTIHWQSLPQTFQDAIVVTTSMNLSYLWIDALCIVQDDQEDWIREASNMTATYAGCQLNISADASTNCDGGLFRNRDPTKIQPFTVISGWAVASPVSYLCHVSGWWPYVHDTTLARRAWVVQERFLSPRVVHFSRDQVHWECAQTMASEALPDVHNFRPDDIWTFEKKSLHRITLTEHDRECNLGVWYKLVSLYAKGVLSYDSDRPIAIAGLARAFAPILGCSKEDYLCGMWRSRLHHDLLWKRHLPWSPIAEKIRNHTSPSWSWLTMNAGIWIYHLDCPKEYDNQQSVVEIIDASTLPLGDPFGPVASGFINIRAPLCRCRLIPGAGFLKETPFSESKLNIKLNNLRLEHSRHFELRLDDPTDACLEDTTTKDVYLMLGRVRNRNNHAPPDQTDGTSTGTDMKRLSYCRAKTTSSLLFGDGKYECLVLQPTGQKQFTRMGYVQFCAPSYRDKDGWENDMKYASRKLDKWFHSHDVPEELYHEVDENFMYSITLI